METQHYSITIPVGSTTVTTELSTPVPVDQSWLVANSRSARSEPGSSMAQVELTDAVDGSYTKLTATRTRGDQAACYVECSVITGQEFAVQHGVSSMSSQTVTVVIDPVEVGESFVVCTSRGGGQITADQSFVRARLTSAEVELAAKGTGASVAWYVVQWSGATVQPQLLELETDAGTTVTADIDTVDLSRAFVLHSWNTTGQTNPGFAFVRARLLQDGDQCKIEVRRGRDSFGLCSVSCFIVYHPGIAVQSGLAQLSSGAATVTLDALDLSRTFTAASCLGNAYFDGNYNSYLQHAYNTHRIYKDGDAYYLEVKAEAIASLTHIHWQAVESVGAYPPSKLKPDSIAIMPSEQNTFQWEPDSASAFVAYEIQWREAGGEWETTGKVVSSKACHVFPAGTFALGGEYEWRVHLWAKDAEDPTIWTTATFNTSNPIIQNPTPWPDTSVRADILQFGGRVKSPYGRAVQLTIEIASDAEFTTPTVYTLPAVESGEVAIVDHAVTEGGTWYIRMTATDTESLQTVLVYSFFAGQFLLFVDTPSVQTQTPQATHVTVRVKGTTTEHTAVITPAPPPEKAIERLIEIESGTVTQCQEVAERLLERWGREQRSISGVVDLIVTLKYQQKVRVKHPQAGIDEELILQKKEHDVLGDQTTHVTLGDIILSDNELLTRILDELG